jgi:hypothetical protein
VSQSIGRGREENNIVSIKQQAHRRTTQTRRRHYIIHIVAGENRFQVVNV